MIWNWRKRRRVKQIESVAEFRLFWMQRLEDAIADRKRFMETNDVEEALANLKSFGSLPHHGKSNPQDQ